MPEKLQYGVTPAQESTCERPHVPLPKDLRCDPSVTPEIYGSAPLTPIPTRIKCLLRAALKRRHVLFFRDCSRQCAHHGRL